MKNQHVWLLAVVCVMLVFGTAMVVPVEDCDGYSTSNRYVTNVTHNSAVVHWDYPPVPTNAMVIRYRPQGTWNWDYTFFGNPDLDCDESGYSIAEDNHYQRYISGLQPNTTYQWQVFVHMHGDTFAAGGFSFGPPFTTGSLFGKQALDGGETEPANLAVQLYPNPVIDQLHLQFATTHPAREVSIVDIHGRTVFRMGGLGDRATLSLGHLPYGIYVLRTEEEGRVVTQERFVKWK